MPATQRIGSLNRWQAAGLGFGCICIGLLAGMSPKYGVLGALGVMFAVVVIMDLTLGFLVFTVASFLDLASNSGSFSGTKVIGLVLFVSWLARLATRRGADLGEFIAQNQALAFALAALLGWSALSFAWAFSPNTALGGAGRYLLVIMLVPIAFSAIRTRQHLIWAVAAFVVGAVLSGVYGFIQPPAAGTMDVGRLAGSLGDSNAEAAVLVAAIPLLIALVASARDSARLKLIGLIGVLLLFVSLLDTLSRGGLIALAAVMVTAVVFGGRWRRQATVLLMIGAIGTAGYYVVLAPASSLQRVTMNDTSGRSSLWTVALRVAKAHPLLGVGNDNFILVSNQYINQPGAIQALFVVNTPKVAHNTYLELLVDLGLPGLLLLLAVLVCSLAAAVRATRIFERLGDRQMELIARGVVLAVVAVLASDFFVSGEYEKYQWLLLALCPVLLAVARRAVAERSPELSERGALPERAPRPTAAFQL
jgi:O-antigen ligase